MRQIEGSGLNPGIIGLAVNILRLFYLKDSFALALYNDREPDARRNGGQKA